MNRPFAPHPFSMTWRAGLFVHWPFDPATVRPLVPDLLELDTRDGEAWISVLPFVLARAGLRGSPSFARLTVPEANVRTYVRLDGVPGLYFFAVDLGHPLLARIVRSTTRLPCNAIDATVRGRDGNVQFRSVRRTGPRSDRPGPVDRPPREGGLLATRSRGADAGAAGGRPSVASEGRADQVTGRLTATYRPDGEPFLAEPGSLDYWLVERRRLYDPVGRGVLYGEVAHDPWPLQPADATLHRNTLFEANGLPLPEREPRLRYCDTLRMTGSIPRVIDAR